jgi:vancomycin aglycone glucosyltransferase
VRVLLSMCESLGGVEPMVVLAVQLQALGAELLARVGAPLVPVGQPVRPMVHGATPPAATDLPRRAATGMMPTRVWR